MGDKIPAGAQLLTLPIDECKLNAGYKAQKYRETYGRRFRREFRVTACSSCQNAFLGLPL